jgi:hypothetical protein
MKRSKGRNIASLAIGLMLLSGCVSTTDISTNSAFPTDFRLDQVYRTEIPLTIRIYHGPFSNLLQAVGPTSANPLPKPEPPGSVWKNYQSYDVLPTGTEIQITELSIFYALVDVGKQQILGTKIKSGRYAGQSIDITKICKTVSNDELNNGFGLYVRDRDILTEEPSSR